MHSRFVDEDGRVDAAGYRSCAVCLEGRGSVTIADEAHALGESFVAARGEVFVAGLNASLNQVFGKAFISEPGAMAAPDGDHSKKFPTTIRPVGTDAPDGIVASEACAVVVAVVDHLDAASLEVAYQQILEAKMLARGPAPGDELIHSTLGVIYAHGTDLALEDIGANVRALNSARPSAGWTDRIIVAGVGTLEYGVQFPGDARIGGSWLPPSKDAFAGGTPSIYVIMAMRPARAHAFNVMLSYLAGHLAAFSLQPDIPPHTAFLDGVGSIVMPTGGYQYDLGGDLRPIPPEMERGRLVPQQPFEIEDQSGEVIASVLFIPWQDGGVVFMEGVFPLPGLLALGDEPFRSATILTPKGGAQISYVLPATSQMFGALLDRFQARSNLRIRQREHKWTMQKVADEGTSTPFVARLMLGILGMRDMVYFSGEQEEFDRRYEVVSRALLGAREAMRQIEAIWAGHAARVRASEIIERRGQVLHVNESVDRPLQREAEGFLNSATRALKLGLQELVKFIGHDIGFLFKKQSTFETGLERLGQSDRLLADYLRLTRAWSEQLIEARNAIEHVGWSLPRIAYGQTPDGFSAAEPMVAGQPVTEFNRHMFDRLCCCIEDVVAHALSLRLPDGMALTEIALADRTAEAPERFALTVAVGGRPIWLLSYSQEPFDEH